VTNWIKPTSTENCTPLT